jgi:hypothetical protein
MCTVCQEVKSASMAPTAYAAAFAGLAVGVKLTWRQALTRLGGKRFAGDREDSDQAEPVG